MLIIGINKDGDKEFFSQIDSGKVSHVRRLAYGSARTYSESELEDFIEDFRTKYEDLLERGIKIKDITDVALFMAAENASKSGLYIASEPDTRRQAKKAP